jgi:hypothetical protein
MLLSVLIFEDVTMYRCVSVFRRFEVTTFLDAEIFVLYRRLLMPEFDFALDSMPCACYLSAYVFIISNAVFSSWC